MMRALVVMLVAGVGCAADVYSETSGAVQVVTEVQITPVAQVATPQVVAEPGPALGPGLSTANQCVEGPPDSDTTGGMDIETFALSRSHSCALLQNKTVRCWGQTLCGVMGNGVSGHDRGQHAPGEVTDLRDVEQLCAGWDFSCALRTGGTVSCWGANSANQVKRSASSCASVATQVPSINRAVGVSCGGQHACARRADGSVWCWGKGAPNYGTPSRVRLPGKAATIVAGVSSTCAILESGALSCWTDEDPPSPTKVDGFPAKVSQIALGERFGCALLDDGQVACWGEGYNGELGVGAPAETATPRLIPGLTKVEQIDANSSRACARTADGALWCWGKVPRSMRNEVVPKRLLSPDRVRALAPVIDFALGPDHSCAQPGPRLLCCWGRNSYGQIGNNTKRDQQVPTLVTW